jgi:hypothetical protein
MRTLDPATDGGAKAPQRLETDLMGWVTTLNPEGQPQSSPIWFLWERGEVLVSFNLNTDPDGEEVVTMEGDARIDLTRPPSSASAAYQAKHRHMIERYGWTPEWLSENYPIPIVITPTRWRLG